VDSLHSEKSLKRPGLAQYKAFNLEMFHSSFKEATNFVTILLAVLGCGCVSNPVPGAFQKEIRNQGFAAFNQPIGDPHNPNDWNKFGPGAILRSKMQTYYYSAKTLIGDQGVKDAMNPQNASPISLFSDKRVSGSDFDGKGGWTLDAVNQIAGAIQFKSVTDVDIQFGKARLANPKSEGDLHQALKIAAKDMDESARTALRKGQFIVVQNAVVVESVRYYFKQTKQGGGSAVYKFSLQEIANLQGKGYAVIDGGVEVDQPRFIAFTPLPNAAEDIQH
jgi:hypothetical protein